MKQNIFEIRLRAKELLDEALEIFEKVLKEDNE